MVPVGGVNGRQQNRWFTLGKSLSKPTVKGPLMGRRLTADWLVLTRTDQGTGNENNKAHRRERWPFDFAPG